MSKMLLLREGHAQDSDAETDFLEQLGQRVRTMRALRGMSRKVLAKVSGISERYIAQLESGKGNVSIVLLRRVSRRHGGACRGPDPVKRSGAGLAADPRFPAKASPAQIAQAKDLLAGGATVDPQASAHFPALP